jgi:hypothetical protein
VFSSKLFMFQGYIGFTCFKWYRSNRIWRHEMSFCCLFDAEKWTSNWGVLYSEQYASLHKLRDSNLLNYIVSYRLDRSFYLVHAEKPFSAGIFDDTYVVFMCGFVDELQLQNLGPFRQSSGKQPRMYVKILYIRNMAAAFLLDTFIWIYWQSDR